MRSLATVLSLAFAACGGDADPAPRPAPILLGVLTPMSGDLAVYGADVHAGTILAVDEINRGGGIDGRLLQLEARDDGTSDEGSRVAFSNLLRLGVAAVIGPGHSAGVSAIADQIRDGDTVIISGSTTAASLADIDDGGFFFRTVPGDDKQGSVLADLIRDAGVTSLCLVHRGDAYGDGLAGVVVAALGDGVTVAAARYDPTESQLDDVLDACEPIRGNAARGILFVTFEGDGKIVMNEAVRRGWRAPDVRIFLVDGNRAQRLYDELDDLPAFEGAMGTSPGGPAIGSEPGVRLSAFRGRFARRWGRPPGTHAENNYDATYLVAAALMIAGPDAGGGAIRDAMAQTRAGRHAAAGDWAEIADAILADGTVDYDGASGAVDLDPASGELDPPFYISVWTIANRRIQEVRVETVEP